MRGLVGCLALLWFNLSFATEAVLRAPPLAGRVIVLDPGHGTINFFSKVINPGRENRWGHAEHRLNLQIALTLGGLLEKEGARVFYTRTRSDYWRVAYGTVEDNVARAFFANDLKAEAYISIHCDWDGRRKTTGITTLYAKENSHRVGEMIHRALITKLKAKNRKLVRDTFTVLDHAEMPAVIVETGFLSNWTEAHRLAKPSYQTQIAQAITGALKNYFTTSPSN